MSEAKYICAFLATRIFHRLWVYHSREHILSGAVMLWADRKPVQSWREIAAEATKETDPKKLIALVETLCEALETIRLERSLGNPSSKPSKSAAAGSGS